MFTVPSLSYCTIADHVNAFGAPISCASTAPLPITASVIWGNKLAGGTTTNVDGPASITYTTTQTTSYPGTGNNISDPMFLRSQHPQMNAIPGAGYGLAAGSPMIDRGSSALVPALDVDGLPRRRFLPNPSSSWISNADRGAFDYSDADGDNMPDGWELAYAFDGANPNDRDLDADQDGFSNFEEYAAKTDPRSSGSRPGPVIYVSPVGNDSSLGGIASPVKTISRAITLSPNSGGRIALMDGTYSGVGNVNLSNSSKSWTLVGINGSARVRIDCENTNRFITTGTYGFSLTGLTIVNGRAVTGNGGAINWAYAAAPITLYRCRFTNCSAPSGTGGALWCTAGSLSKCEFLGNTATYGGAVGGITYPGGSSYPPSITLQDNSFAWNDASQQGGALSYTGIIVAQLTRNAFYRNSALSGGAILFKDCLATNYSGNSYYSTTSATVLPGSVNYGYNHPTLADNTFTENSAWSASAPGSSTSAGAMLLTNSSIWLSGGSFEGNLSKGNGGAIVQSTGVSQIQRAKFMANEALAGGGVASVTARWPAFINCACVGNRAALKGGAFITATGSKLTLRHATLTGNWVLDSTGGSVCWNDGLALNVENSLLWHNTPAQSPFAGSGPRTFTGTNAEPGTLPAGGTYNTSVLPRLAWDRIHLTGLPASLNSGNPTLPNAVAQFTPDPDLDSDPRSTSTANAPDAGCDEFLDSDGDGLPNWYEKQLMALSPGVTDIQASTLLWGTQVSALQYLTSGANPLRMDADTDGDGLTDAREFALNLNPTLTDSNGDGTRDIDPVDLDDPTKDSDGDGLLNAEDAVPWDARLHFRRVPESRYVVVPLGPGVAKFLNDLNQVVLYDSAKPTSGVYQAPQGLRVWDAGSGLSRPIELGSGWEAPAAGNVADLDNTGRLLIGSNAPNPPSIAVPSPRYALFFPLKPLVIDDLGASNTVSVLPNPEFPAKLDLGSVMGGASDGFYSGGSDGSKARGLFDNGNVMLGELDFKDSAISAPMGPLNNLHNREWSQILMKGTYWSRNSAGGYQAETSLDDVITKGRPTGYGYSYNQTSIYENGLNNDSTWRPLQVPSQKESIYGDLPGRTVFNHSGFMAAEYGPSTDYLSFPQTLSRVQRQLTPTTHATYEFSTSVGILGGGTIHGGPFIGISDMKVAECGSGPLLFHASAPGKDSGFVWEADPVDPGAGSWKPFKLTNKDGSASGLNTMGAIFGPRGEIAT